MDTFYFWGRVPEYTFFYRDFFSYETRPGSITWAKSKGVYWRIDNMSRIRSKPRRDYRPVFLKFYGKSKAVN